jgi:tetratricopeptide (TPR) repeat protein
VRILKASFVAAGNLIALFAQAQTLTLVRPTPDVSIDQTTAVASNTETPAQQRIRSAKRRVETSSVKPNALNDLAIAYLRRARETDESTYLIEAGKALNQGLRLAPADFQLQKTQVALLLAKHQYPEAKDKATLLNKHTPDDVMTYGYIAEADIALGDLDAAEKSAQWMLNMRPNNIHGLLLGSRLRSLYGDTDGALDFLKLAYAETSPTEVEDLAWIANQMASIEIDAGRNEAATAMLEEAQQLFPNYPYTLKNLGRVKLEQHRPQVGQAGQIPASPAPVQVVPQSPPSNGAALTAQPVQKSATTVFAPVSTKLLTPLPTDTDRLIHKAQGLVASDPKDATGYSALGAAHFQRARETGDVSDYQLAEESLNKSLDLVSTDFTADQPLGTLAEVCMGEHRFNDALTYAQRALSLGSGDVSSFAIAGDAFADMGEYDKASQAYARLTPRDMTLSPRAAYARDSRIAYLKFIVGDTTGAIALMRTAVAEGAEAQLPIENLAWLYYELGEFSVQAGDTASADTAYVTALTVHPGDYRTLASLGKLRANNGRYAEAIELYNRAISVVPMPVFVAELGDLYAKAGNQVEAEKQYQLVEYIGLLGHINQVLHNRDLALFYADHDIKLPEALELAQKELEVRHDVYTWDALAWALYKNGKYEESAKAIQKALQYGTKDSLLLFHSGMIAERTGQHDQAKIDLTQALVTNPHFHLLYSDQAQKQLGRLTSQALSGGSHAR